LTQHPHTEIFLLPQYSLQKGSSHLSIVDLHSHIVPAVDDGAGTVSEAVEMIINMRDRLESGSTVVFTPHYTSSMGDMVVTGKRRISIQFQKQMEEKFKEEISFFSAGELMLRGASLKHIEEVRYPGTGWVLVEFDTTVSWIETLIQLKRILRKGYYPLIAHPERYRWCRQSRKRLIKLSRMGCGAAVSARSFRFKKYAAAARCLLTEGFCHCLCSDAHSPKDLILDNSLKDRIQGFSTVPWSVLTSELPELILNDMKLPELPLFTHRKSK
jgi:protein-tyrosine phosphatase